MATTLQLNAIEQHGKNLLAIFPKATERDPVALCKKLRRLEARGAALALENCNVGVSDDEYEQRASEIITKVNTLLGNANEYQPKIGAKCGCRRGIQRDNCANCEGTGQVVDFHAIRNRKPLVPVFLNGDPRGYALKIESGWMREQNEFRLHSDMGGYGILAPEIGKDGR
jgi:hypothetical protein